MGVAWYSDTSKLLMDHMGTDEETVWSAIKCVTLVVWVRWIRGSLWLGDLGAIRIQKTGGLFILTRKDLPQKTGRNDYSIRAGESQRYFMIITESKSPPIFIYYSSENCFLYPQSNLETMMNTRVMHEISFRACKERFGTRTV